MSTGTKITAESGTLDGALCDTPMARAASDVRLVGRVVGDPAALTGAADDATMAVAPVGD